MKKLLTLLLASLMLVSVVSCGALPKEDKNKAEDSAVILTESLEDLAAASKMSVTAVDDAYVRGGVHKTTCYSTERNTSGELEIKTDIPDYTREVLIKFDISELALTTAQSVYLYVNLLNGVGGAKSGNDLYLYVYEVDGKWDSSTVTHNTAPTYDANKKAGACLVPGGGGVCAIDVSGTVFDARNAGKTELSFRLAFSEQTVSQGFIASTSCETSYVRPKLMARNSATGSNYEKTLLADSAANDALWAYAEEMYDSWYGRYQEILEKRDYSYESVTTNSDEYNLKVSARGGNGSSQYHTFDTRLMSDLKGYKETVYDVSRYGGVLSAEKQKATGYYYTTKIGDRWWAVDPLGNLMHIHGTSHLKYAYISTSEAQKEAALRVFGSYEKWAIAATRWAKNDLGFNATYSVAAVARKVEDPIPNLYGVSGVSSYANSIGGLVPNGGGIPQFVGGAMPVFDPGFETYMDDKAETAAAANKGKSYIIGYITDNEIVVSDKMLASYLTLDHTVECSIYSYVCAWTWYKNITGEENPSVYDIAKYSEARGEDLYDLFKGFIYNRYFSVCQKALEKHDPNRLYFGQRFLIDCSKWEWMLRMAGYWCDVVCLNYYHEWEVPTSRATKNGRPTLDQMGAWMGKPFLVTEFYSKGNDAVDINGQHFVNDMGAGWVVDTQTERGYFYQNYTLKLLQCKHSIGWMQFQFIDNDPTVENGESSNKGIVDSQNDFTAYSDFTDQLAMLNKNTYALIEYFDGVSYFK